MAGRWDTVAADGSDMRCYVAEPAGSGPFPAVIVIQHAGGVDEFVRTMTDRAGEAGFVGIAPDLYHREDPNSGDDALTRMSHLRDANIIKRRRCRDRSREDAAERARRQHRHHRLLHGRPRGVSHGNRSARISRPRSSSTAATSCAHGAKVPPRSS